MLAWSPWDLVLPCPSICTSGLQNDDFDILMKKIRDGVAENPNIDKALELYDDVQGCFIDIDYARRDQVLTGCHLFMWIGCMTLYLLILIQRIPIIRMKICIIR